MAALDLPLSPLVLTGVPLQLQPGSPGASLPPLSPEVCKDVEREADQLFLSHTVEEIKSIARDKRLEIDRRREDLRQMVGERYRDLIDAADSIMHMKKCSEQAKQSVATMEGLCQRLQQVHFLRGSGGSRGPAPKIEGHAVAAQVKLLADAPENIWLYLENRGYLSASLTFLLARHVFSQLTIKLGTERSFAVVQRLWHSVATFKDTIVKSASSHLRSAGLEQEAMLQSLCAIALLEGGSPRQLLAQTLLARKSSIQSVFSPKAEHLSVKSQVCQLVKTIVDSLVQISAIFCTRHNQSSSSLLVERLVQLTKKECIQNMIPAALASRLPDTITGFTPSIASPSLSEIPVNDIHSSASDWVTMCVTDVRHGMESTLQHITTFKALAAIREAVHNLLSKNSLSPSGDSSSLDELSLAEAREEWARICQSVLGSKLCVWDTFLRSLLFQRAKALVDKHLAKGGANANTLLGDLLRSHISAVGDIWMEEPVNQSSSEFKPLSLKAKACSPLVFSFCQGFDDGFKNLIYDIAHFLGDNGLAVDSYWKHPATITTTVASYPFPLWEDSHSLQAYLQESVRESIGRFLKNIGCKVSEIQDQLKNQHTDCSLVDRLVLLGNLCQCLMDCCPNFSFLASGCSPRTKFTTRSQKKATKEDNRGQLANEILQEKALFIFKVWSEWCSGELVAQLQEQLSAEMELNSLASSLVWDKVQISEESESGEKVTSIIRVPSQTSVYVTSLLFALSQEISRIGGHVLARQTHSFQFSVDVKSNEVSRAIRRSILEDLSGDVFHGVLECYESLLSTLNQRIPQPCALQLLFNLKFFSNVLVHPSSREGTEKIDPRLKIAVESLQSFVDPFDLDVFMPHILTNLERQLTRSSVLYGLLLSLKDIPVSTSFYKKPTTLGGGAQEQHIVIPLAAPINRLPSLPITVPTLAVNHATQEAPTDMNIALIQTVTFFHHF